MMKKLLSTFLVLMVLSLGAATAFAVNPASETDATALNKFGLFQGTGTDASGDPEFSLEKNSTRQEAVTMLIRLLGKEADALAASNDHPFTDVSNWANPYVGYAYANGLTNGVSDTRFGANDMVNSQQYITFLLRALGYSEVDGDFEYANVYTFSDSLGLTDGDYSANDTAFIRGDLVSLSTKSLLEEMKGTETSLLNQLYADKVITETQYAAGTSYLFIDADEAEIKAMVEKADKALEDADSYSMDIKADVKMTIDGETIPMIMNGSISQAMQNNNTILEAILNTEVLGQKVEIKMYYADGFYYTDTMGEKVKVAMDVEEAIKAASGMNIDLNTELLSNPRILQDKTKIEYIIPAETMEEILEFSLQAVPDTASAGTDISTSDIKFIGTLENDNWKTMEISFSMAMTVEDQVFDMEYVMTMDITKIGGVSITLPTDLDSYELQDANEATAQ